MFFPPHSYDNQHICPNKEFKIAHGQESNGNSQQNQHLSFLWGKPTSWSSALFTYGHTRHIGSTPTRTMIRIKVCIWAVDKIILSIKTATCQNRLWMFIFVFCRVWCFGGVGVSVQDRPLKILLDAPLHNCLYWKITPIWVASWHGPQDGQLQDGYIKQEWQQLFYKVIKWSLITSIQNNILRNMIIRIFPASSLHCSHVMALTWWSCLRPINQFWINTSK